jgi:hypothetical protein
MKNQTITACFLLLIILIVGCSALKMDTQSLYVMRYLSTKKEMIITLEDKSGFDIDIQNYSNDTLIVRRADHQDQIVLNKKISASVAAAGNIEILNV